MARRTKIVATLGPATSTEEAIGALVRAGVDVTRFNFSHGDHNTHLKNAEVVRGAAHERGRNVAILQDIQGPKIRTGEVAGDTELIEGSRIVLAPGISWGTPAGSPPPTTSSPTMCALDTGSS
jgi:pyruvate kinase